VQQARNLALDLGDRFRNIRILIRDHGPDFTASIDAVFQAAGTTIVRTVAQAPRMNAICERLTGTLRRELPDRTLDSSPAPPARGPGRVPGALQHRPAPSGHRPAHPGPRPCSPHPRSRPRHMPDPPKPVLSGLLTSTSLPPEDQEGPSQSQNRIFERHRVPMALWVKI
jgi:putative transposase